MASSSQDILDIPKKISQIITLIVSFQHKIQNYKAKICSFPQFSPTKFFDYLDSQNKGYLSSEDCFRIIEQKVQIRYIDMMIERLNNSTLQTANQQQRYKLTYFSFLSMVKPYHNELLAKDLLARDTLSSKNRTTQNFTIQSNQWQNHVSEAILYLLVDLFKFYCIFSAELQKAKAELMQKYRLSVYQLMDIIQIESVPISSQDNNQLRSSPIKFEKDGYPKNVLLSPLKKLDIFLQNHSQYQIESHQLKELLSYCRCHQYVLLTQKYLSMMLLPSRYYKKNSLNNSQQIDLDTERNILNIQDLRLQTLRNSPNKIEQRKKYYQNTQYARMTNFLNIVHPMSINKNSIQHKKQQDHIKEVQKKWNPREQKKIIQSYVREVGRDVQPQLFGENSVLNKFMKQSNIMKNMSRAKPHIIDNYFSKDSSSAFEIVKPSIEQQSRKIISKQQEKKNRRPNIEQRNKYQIKVNSPYKQRQQQIRQLSYYEANNNNMAENYSTHFYEQQLRQRQYQGKQQDRLQKSQLSQYYRHNLIQNMQPTQSGVLDLFLKKPVV